VLDGKGAKYVVETMWMLMEAGLEEVRNIISIIIHVTFGFSDPDLIGSVDPRRPKYPPEKEKYSLV
jgi:hypothetical protein